MSVPSSRLAVLLGHFHLSDNPSSSWAEPPSTCQLQLQHASQSISNAVSSGLVICGGVVLDVQACSSSHQLQRGSSVPGQVKQLPGGVARNIADAVSQLMCHYPGPPPQLVSVVGQDAAGDVLMNHLRTLRLDISHVRQVPAMRTACVSAVLDSSGEVACCVADVSGPEQYLTPIALIAQLRPALTGAPLLVVETNLGQPAVAAVCAAAAQAGVPVLVEPVSVPKAARAVGSLQHLDWITPNGNELIAIADEVCRQQGRPLLNRPTGAGGVPGLHIKCTVGAPDKGVQAVADLLDQLPFADLVLSEGTRRILVTLGGQGAALITRQPVELALAGQQHVTTRAHGQHGRVLHIVHLPALPAKVVNLSGAGDTLVGGLVAGLMHGLTDVQAMAMGMAAACRTVQCDDNVAQTLSFDELRKDSQQALAGVARFEATLP